LGDGLYNPRSGYPFGGAEAQFHLQAADPAFEVAVLTTVRETPVVERVIGGADGKG
jgi:hypothetical protein